MKGKRYGNWFDINWDTSGFLFGFTIYEENNNEAIVLVKNIDLSQNPTIINANLSITFILEETGGISKTFEELAIAILDESGRDVFVFANYSNETIDAGGVLTKSATNQIYDSHQPGTYQVVIRGKYPGGDWFDFSTIENGINPKSFEVVSDSSANNPPDSVTATPENGLWSDPEKFIDISCPGADVIYCKVSISEDGSAPADPPEPTIESHDIFNRNMDETIGETGQFQIWADDRKIKTVKVRFRGYNQYGYGPSSSVYTYTIDRTATTPVAPQSVTVSPETGNWEASPQFVNVSCPGADRIYCTVNVTRDGTSPEDPSEPTLETHDLFNRSGDDSVGPSGQFEMYADPGEFKILKVRFRGYSEAGGYGPASPIYTYRIDMSDGSSGGDKPDFFVRDLYLTSNEDENTPKTTFALNEPIRIFTRVKNNGGADAERDIRIEYFLSPGTTIAADPHYIGHDDADKDDLTVRSSAYEDYHYDKDDGLPTAPGIYNITVRVDTEGKVDETNENNNVFDPPLVFEVVGDSPGPGQGNDGDLTNNIDSALIIDSSGSMDDNDGDNNRLEAARFFIDRADDNDHITVIDFDDFAYVDNEKGTIRIAKDNRVSLKEAVNQIDSAGGTNLSAGLSLAFEQLSSSTSNNQKIAVLLTDGDGEYSGEAADYQAKGWKIYTIALGSDANDALLTEIASITGGQFFKVTTEDAAKNAITEIYKKINRTAHKSEFTIHQESMTILPGQVVERYIDVPEGTESLWVDRIIPGSDVEMSLVSPDGTVIDRNTQNPNVYHALGATYEIYRVTKPTPGRWKVIMKGTDVAPEGEPTDLSVAINNPNYIPPNPHDMTVDEGDQCVLNGLETIHADKNIVSYHWQLVGKSQDWVSDIELRTPNMEKASFTAPQVGTDNCTLTFQLTVTDTEGRQHLDTYTVNVINHGPGEDGGGGGCFVEAIH